MSPIRSHTAWICLITILSSISFCHAGPPPTVLDDAMIPNDLDIGAAAAMPTDLLAPTDLLPLHLTTMMTAVSFGGPIATTTAAPSSAQYCGSRGMRVCPAGQQCVMGGKIGLVQDAPGRCMDVDVDEGVV